MLFYVESRFLYILFIIIFVIIIIIIISGRRSATKKNKNKTKQTNGTKKNTRKGFFIFFHPFSGSLEHVENRFLNSLRERESTVTNRDGYHRVPGCRVHVDSTNLSLFSGVTRRAKGFFIR